MFRSGLQFEVSLYKKLSETMSKKKLRVGIYAWNFSYMEAIGRRITD
jgi:hypothetical protein